MTLDKLFNGQLWLWEGRLVNWLGINRDELRALRERAALVKGEDWRIRKNRAEVTRRGVEKLEAYLKLPGAAPQAVQTTGATPAALGVPEQKKVPPAAAGEQPQRMEDGESKIEEKTARLCVWRVFPKNRHIIEAYKPGTDPAKRENVLRVRVKDSSKFTRFDNTGKPMAIECQHLQVDFWEHVGPTPRRKGRQ